MKIKIIIAFCFSLITTNIKAQAPFSYNWNGNGFYSSATQAKRYTIGRVYYNAIHWGHYGNMKIKVKSTYFSSGNMEYLIQNQQSGASIFCTNSFGTNSGYAKISLGEPVNTGTHYAGGDNFYRDIFFDALYYTQWNIECEGLGFFQLDKTSIQSTEYWYLTLFSSPSSQDIPSVWDSKVVQLSSGGHTTFFDGKVGIGTLQPSALVDIKTNPTEQIGLAIAPSGSHHSYFSIDRKTGYDGGMLWFKDGNYIWQNVNGDDNTQRWYSYTRAGGGQHVLALDKEGYMGLGANQPLSRLHIGGSNQEIRFDYNGTGNHYGGLRWAGLQLGNNGQNRIVAGRTALGGWLDFFVNNTNEGSDYSQTPNGVLAMRLTPSGNVGIGTTNPGAYKLAVEGTIGARKLKVTQGTWADDVFKKNYKLRPIIEVEKYIQQHGHLPEVPSEKEVKGKDLDISETQTMLLKKIEELTLYMIELKKENTRLNKKYNTQQTQISQINKKIKN